MINRKHNKGFTLIELMVVITISAILVAMAGPSFQNIAKKNEVGRTTQELLSSLTIARKEAAVSGRTSKICVVADITTKITDAKALKCLTTQGQKTPWQQLADTDTSGWIVFQDRNNDNEANKGETLYKRSSLKEGRSLVEWTGNADNLTLSARNVTNDIGTFRIAYPDKKEKLLTWSDKDTPKFKSKIYENRISVTRLGKISHTSYKNHAK